MSKERDHVGRGDLAGAHRGYIYQDVATAYLLSRALYDGATALTVDCKEHAGDIFDDLTVQIGGRRIRRQFKSSVDARRPFAAEDIRTKTSGLRIDDIVKSYCGSLDNPADEYRICATWAQPEDKELLVCIEPIAAMGSFEGWPTRLYRLRADVIWPEHGPFRWAPRTPQPHNRGQFSALTDRLVIELECPQISLNMAAPGALERLLIAFLSESIGVGRYPNHEMHAQDFAHRLILRASYARAQRETLDPHAVFVQLGLRTDYGRVPQRFPVVAEHLVTRTTLLDQLKAAVLAQPYVLLIGPPGSGKSWLLTDLGDRLAAGGHLVARHYCYLEPGDLLRERRITSNTLFGNLISGVLDAAPELACRQHSRYSAGPDELQELLGHAAESKPDRRVVLMVDGLDHIARVLSETDAVAPEDAAIIEELSRLELPAGVCLVLGSQPGQHLDLLHHLGQPCLMPPMVQQDIDALAERLGVDQRLAAAGFDTERSAVEALLATRSEGNPLYATYLCRELLAALEHGGVMTPMDVLAQAPQLGADLANYYGYLLGDDAPTLIARRLALLAFAVTEGELCAMTPPEAQPDVHPMLVRLAPVLTQVHGQGGIRVYHESFRRFIVDHRTFTTVAREAVLQSIVEWLERLDFYSDSRAYQFLLPYLRHLGRPQQILNRVGVDFVAHSLEAGHAEAAIHGNLDVAVAVAAEGLNWPVLVRLAEIHQSVGTCFREKLLDFVAYARAFASIHGWAALSERLVFDGRPTRPRGEGLLLCSLVDDAGAAAPWPQYLSLPGDDALKDDHKEEALAAFHGFVLTPRRYRLVRHVASWFAAHPKAPRWYIRGLLERLLKHHGAQSLRCVLRQRGVADSTRAECAAVLARGLAMEGDPEGAQAWACIAAAYTDDPTILWQSAALGAAPEVVLPRCPDLRSVAKSAAARKHSPDEEEIAAWIAGTSIAALTDPVRLAGLTALITGTGWYIEWLRFVLTVAQAESMAKMDDPRVEPIILEALGHLRAETGPFVGSVRACDLYPIRELVHDSFRRALALLQTDAAWGTALSMLRAISRSTTTYLQGSPSGPLTAAALASIVTQGGDTRPTIIARIATLIEEAVASARTHGEFYELQAELEMYAVVAYAASGNAVAAAAAWRRACGYLVGYGFRKDITVFHLIDSLPALIEVGVDGARARFRAVQRLVYEVDDHTDGAETKHALIRWFGLLAAAEPAPAARLLARSMCARPAVMDWRVEECTGELVRAVADVGDTVLLSRLHLASPASVSLESIERRLRVIQRLRAQDPADAMKSFGLMLAQITAEHEGIPPQIITRLSEFAQSQGWPFAAEMLPSAASEVSHRDETVDHPDAGRSVEQLVVEPLLPSAATSVQILARLRRGYGPEREPDLSRMTNALGYRLVELLDGGREEEAVRIIEYASRNHHFGTTAAPLAALADGLVRHGYHDVSAIAFALAYSSSHGGGGWFMLGGDEAAPWFMRALELNAGAAWSAMAEYITHLLSKRVGYYAGLSQNIITLCARCGNAQVAGEAWREAFAVISARLPESQGGWRTLLPLDDDEREADWSLDESLVLLLLARLNRPDAQVKNAALAGCTEAMAKRPDLFGRAIREFLSQNTLVTSMLLVLRMILEVDAPPFPVTHSVRDLLQAISGARLFGPSKLANLILERAHLS